MEENLHLKKDLSCWDCSGIIVGIIIGIGIFTVFPTLVAQQNISTGMILLAWLVGGVFAWFGAMCYAELSSIFPHAGGDYTFLREGYSTKGENVVSFLFAWSQVFVIRPASIVMMSLIFGAEMQKLFLKVNINIWNAPVIVAFFLLVFLTVINFFGIKTGKKFQNFLTLVKLLFLVLIIGFGFYNIIHSTWIEHIPTKNLLPAFLPEGKSVWKTIAGFWTALVYTMWVYGGWNEAAYVAEEVKNPAKDIPKALFMGIFGVMILYVAINFVYIFNFSPRGLTISWTPSSDLMTLWFGSMGGDIMSVIIMICAAGAVNGLILTSARMSYAIAKDYPGLKLFSSINPRTFVPVRSLLGNFLISVILLSICLGKDVKFIDNLNFYTAGVFWYFFGIVVISLIIFRSKLPKDKIPFKVPFYPYSPILFLIITGSMIWGSLQYKPFETLAGISVLTIGIPIYYLLNLKNNQETQNGKPEAVKLP